MNRRRRASSVASRQGQEEEVIDDSTPEQSPVLPSTSTGRKRKRLDPSELCQQLYDSIRNIKKEDGSMLCDTFIRAPKRRQEPSYYEVVTNPIDLLKVQQKLKTDSYDDVDELSADIELLVNNAKAFYKPDTTEYQDACTLWQYFNTNRAKVFESAGIEDEPRTKRIGRIPRRSFAQESETSEGSKVDDDFDQYEELFIAVMTATDEGRPLHKEFQILPSKRLYPDYYDVIEHPIDLKLIANKIQTNAYSNIGEMEKDLLQMTKNACMFNEPGSQIYKDAKTLKKIFTQKKIEIESGKAKPTLGKRRGQPLSAITANLKEDVSSDEEGESGKKGEGPMWQLFDHLFNAASASDHPTATGAPLGHSLWKLPHRRFHPEYYEQIKKPLSMAQIQNKLKKGDYANISNLTADLYLMLDNAKKAYPPTHRTHKDALKMQKIMNAKLLDDGLDQDGSESDEAEAGDAATPTVSKKKRRRGYPGINSPSSNGTASPAHTMAANSSPKNRVGLNAVLKKKMLALHKSLIDFTLLNGRRPADLFIEKPHRKMYPDYYEVISQPIDLTTIENNLKTDKYSSIEEVVSDYRLMFSNCRQYNEEGSAIFEDANTLENSLNEKLKEFPGLQEIKRGPAKMKPGRRIITPLFTKLCQFYDAIKDYHEPKGNRQLSMIFMKLPSKNDYPDYYDIIKDPMDMEKIAQKLRTNQYESVDDMASDFVLMLENACKYNEPDSQIYKDALLLQQLTIQTKQSLRDNDETVPDVSLAVQELLLSLFTLLYNHQDEEGRCFSDSLAELPEYDEVTEDKAKVRGISLDLIKRRLDKGAYKRLDTFQEDMFSCLERARKLSRTDSQIFEDSIELQTFFIKQRDKLCKDTLSSPALSYTLEKLIASVEAIRQSKSQQEEQDQEDDEKAATQSEGESMTIDQKVFSPGEFVYFQSPENKIPGIAYIERLWTNSDGVKMMNGNVFLRPHETYHVTTRKFLENELFKTGLHQAIPLDRVLNKCYVMNVKDYIKFKPEGFADKDVFVCESRYNMRARSFNKIKNWTFIRENDPVQFIARPESLELKRVMSVFKERVEKHKGELAELKLQEALIEKEKPNILSAVGGPEANSTYYEQYNTICSGVVKIGDFVYVATQAGKQSISQIHFIWETEGGKSYFQGPWLLSPGEIIPTPQRSFYRQELLLSTVHDINPIIAIVGRCAALEYSEFTTCRPTEIAESDVYITESVYDELKKCIRKFSPDAHLKKFTHCEGVTPDEIFHFKRPIKPIKVNANNEPILSPEIKLPGSVLTDVKADPNDSISVLEDSLDGGPPSVGSDIAATCSPAPSYSNTPASAKLKMKNKSKVVTGYILYSAEVRKGISDSNPDASFGDISRIVGNEWKNLPTTIRQSWEDKAIKMNEEQAAKKRLELQNRTSPLPGSEAIEIYECLWNKCDYQFEDPADRLDHCIHDDTGHVQATYPQADEAEFHCLWKRCIRLKKSMPPFANLVRLIKHVREVHLSKAGKMILLTEKGRNFVPRKNAAAGTPTAMHSPVANIVTQQVSPQMAKPQQQLQQQQMIIAAPPPEPMFVTVPPRPQRVLHSEAYIRYIEGLQADKPYISPWNRTLNATQQNTPPVDVSRLPTQWLGKQAEQNPETVVNALWHLRNFMMKDVVEIQRCGFH